MTDEIGFSANSGELYRWDKDGKLIFIHPSLVFEINKHIEVHMTEQSVLIQQLTGQVAELMLRDIELQTRVAALEEKTSVPTPATYYVRPSMPFGSTAKLVEQVESMFDCRDGDYRAWHSVWSAERGTYDDYPYAVIGLIASATIPDAQERLRQALYSTFHKLKLTCKSERPVLYWRYGAAERIQEDAEIYARGTSFEKAEKYKIMTRIAIPEADFSAVAEVVKGDNYAYMELKE